MGSDQKDLGKLIGQMELVLAKLESLETRMRALEKFRWKVAGGAVIAGAGAGALSKLLG